MEAQIKANSVPVQPRHSLLAFVALHHAEQRRKYTNAPYLSHLQDVAEMADGQCKLGYEIGLCHDLLEDTICTETELLKALLRFGYDWEEATWITIRVFQLTDQYTPFSYPDLNRKKRKELEAKRLSHISSHAQTVKYCDIINNSESILQHDPSFAKVYITEMKMVLDGMNRGNEILYKKALESVNKTSIGK